MSSMNTIRRQITLFVPKIAAQQIEVLREQFNPVQYGLIAAHVTLCRDDEVQDWMLIKNHCEQLGPIDLELLFGRPTKSDDWVYLPVVGSTGGYDNLRRLVLNSHNCRKQTPHITLVHPRNGRCSDKQFSEIRKSFPAEIAIRFQQLTLIEQHPGDRWREIGSS